MAIARWTLIADLNGVGSTNTIVHTFLRACGFGVHAMCLPHGLFQTQTRIQINQSDYNAVNLVIECSIWTDSMEYHFPALSSTSFS